MELEEIFLDAYSQKGAGRENNQDSVGMLDWINDQTISDRFTENFTKTILPSLFLLADGVGGHAKGDTASRKSIQIIKEQFDRSIEGFNILKGIISAHAALSVKPQILNSQMGTTIVGLVLCPDRAEIFNVGDSRLYLKCKKNLRLLSVDDRIDKTHRNIITQCIGGSTKIPKPHLLSLKRKKKDEFILLSDGVTDWLSETKIFEILSSNEDNKSSLICQEAIKAGSKDDVSALIVKRLN